MAWMLAIIGLAAACVPRRPFHEDRARQLIEASAAWRSPVAPQVYVDPSFRPPPTSRREMIRIEIIDRKEDGPWGMAGQTASSVFSWRWHEGYAGNKVFRTTAKFNNNGDGWKVYDDLLGKALWASERGDVD